MAFPCSAEENLSYRKLLVDLYTDAVLRYQANVEDLAALAGGKDVAAFEEIQKRCAESHKACRAAKRILDSNRTFRLI